MGEYLRRFGNADRRHAGEERWRFVDVGRNPYPMAALLLASYADEMHAYDECRGGPTGPGHAAGQLDGDARKGVVHDGHASPSRIRSRRSTRRLTIRAGCFYDEAKARLLRNKGAALVELGRLDEAEAALDESIRLMPNNPQAQRRTATISASARGGPRTDIQIAMPQSNQPADEATAPAKARRAVQALGREKKPHAVGGFGFGPRRRGVQIAHPVSISARRDSAASSRR